MPAEWLAPPGDAPALAALLIRAAKRPQAPPELGQALRAKVVKDFGLEACVARFQRVYEAATGRT
jgi:glycosyltransferase involved in cell wall biosynthesis